MATKPTTVPGWVPVGTTPTAGQKTAGVATAGPLPAGWVNWFWTLVSGWVAYLRDGVIVGEAGEPGLTVTAGTGNKPGVDSTGTGTGPGVKGTGGPTGNGVEGVGGASGGYGVKGTGTNNSEGGNFTGAGTGSGVVVVNSGSQPATLSTGTGSGAGVKAVVSGGTGYGFECTPNTTKASIFLGSFSSDPSSLADSAVWYNSTAGKFRGRANGVTVDFH